MGCSVPHQLGLSNSLLETLPSNQGLVPDVYEGDTVFSWATAKPHIVGAIVKAYEYRQDHKFRTNWQILSALHIWHTAYLFMHSCSEVVPYVSVVNSVGGFNQPYTGPPVIDAEVSEAGPALSCTISTVERLTHRRAIEYTSPGANPGGDHRDAILWSAGYGNYSHCPFVWTGNCIAWQYTDGTFGPHPHSIPGIQPGDISVSYGIQHLVYKKPVPAKLVCFGPKAHKANSTCKKVEAQVAGLQRGVSSSTRAYTVRGCPVLAQRVVWFSSAIKAHPRSSRTARRRRALASSRTGYQRRSCSVFAGRVLSLNNQIKRIESRY